jgi:hypothetical protein
VALTGAGGATDVARTHTHTLIALGLKALPPFPRDRFPGG